MTDLEKVHDAWCSHHRRYVAPEPNHLTILNKYLYVDDRNGGPCVIVGSHGTYLVERLFVCVCV